MVKITLNNNLLTVSSNSEGGATCADLEIDYTGDEFIVGLNAQYLTKIMKVMQGNVVTFGFGTPLSAVTVQDCADDITVCMPLIIR
jgi:DNA polymerase III sliding clamp (beta) subunit (PCNA family)